MIGRGSVEVGKVLQGDELGHDAFLEGRFQDLFKEVGKDFCGDVLM